MAQADGSFNAVEADALELALSAAVFHYLKHNGEADAVAFYLRGHCCKCRTAFVLLVCQVVEPVCIFVHRFFGQA